MAAKTGTYTLISSNTLGSAAASVTFSSIPQTYTDLRLVINCGTATDGYGINIRYNGDTSSIYSDTGLWGTGSSASTGRHVAQNLASLTIAVGGSTSPSSTTILADIMDYANTTTYKTSICRSNRASSGVDAIVNLFSSTSAITSISLATNTFTGTANLQSGTTFKLYGIQAGNA